MSDLSEKTPRKKAERLTLGETYQLGKWMSDNQGELMSLGPAEIAEQAGKHLGRGISPSSITLLREELNWPPRGNDPNQLHLGLEDHENRIRAIEIKLGLRPETPTTPL